MVGYGCVNVRVPSGVPRSFASRPVLIMAEQPVAERGGFVGDRRHHKLDGWGERPAGRERGRRRRRWGVMITASGVTGAENEDSADDPVEFVAITVNR